MMIFFCKLTKLDHQGVKRDWLHDILYPCTNKILFETILTMSWLNVTDLSKTKQTTVRSINILCHKIWLTISYCNEYILILCQLALLKFVFVKCWMLHDAENILFPVTISHIDFLLLVIDILCDEPSTSVQIHIWVLLFAFLLSN